MIWVDTRWGTNGPYNTFFRNKVRRDDEPLINHYGGIRIENGSQNSYGNALYDVDDDQHYNAETEDNYNGRYTCPNGDAGYNDISYFYEQKPKFLNGYQWPVLGTKGPNGCISPQRLPAEDRYNTTMKAVSSGERVITAGNNFYVSQYSDVALRPFGFYNVFEGSAYITQSGMGTRYYSPSFTAIVKYDQSFRTGTTEKFNKNFDKTLNTTSYINYFTAQASHDYVGIFSTASNVTLTEAVQVDGISATPSGAYLQFKDPWLIDQMDAAHPEYGLYNAGMSAQFKNLAHGANSLGTTTSNKVYS